jgi:hypothetical protein
MQNRAWLKSHVDSLFVVGLVLAGAILPLVISAIAGSLEVPRNDDWSYRRIASALASTGRLELDGAAETMLIGQVAITQPLLWLSGGHTWAFTTAGFLFAVGGVVGAYALARQIARPSRAALASVLLLLFPGYLAYATSYMNDVPAMATQFIAVAVGAAALARRPVAFGWLVVALLLGCFAFSMRHFALAAPAAILLAALCAEPKRMRTIALVAMTAVICLGVQLFRSTLSGQLGHINLNLNEALRLPSAIVTISFVLLPAALLALGSSRGSWRRRDVLMGAIVGIGVVAVSVAQWVKWGTFPTALMGNLVTQYGVPDSYYISGGRPLLFPDPAWTAVNVVALIAVVVVPACIAGVAGRYFTANASSISGRLRSAGSARGVVLLYVLLAGGGLLLYGSVYGVFDRYLWPLVPPVAALLLAHPIGKGPVWARSRAAISTPWAVIGGAAILALFALPIAANSNAFDAAKWTAGNRLVAAGIPADQIDAGYEWMGFHVTAQPTPTKPTPAPIWYRRWWHDFKLCGLVSSDPTTPPEGVPLGRVTYRLDLVAGPLSDLWLYKIDSPACRRSAAIP